MRKQVIGKNDDQRRRIKRLLLFILVLVLSFQVCQSATLAATLTKKMIDNWQFYVNYKGKSYYRYVTRLWLDGKEVFCVQAEQMNDEGDEYPDPIPASQVYDPDTLHRVGLITLFGFEMTGKSDIDAAFTKLFVYEAFGYTIPSLTDRSGQGVFTANRYNTFKADLETKISAYMKRASFHGEQVDVKAGTSITLTDGNGVLDGYKVASTPAGVTASISGQTLHVSAEAAASDGQIVLRRDTVNNGTSLLYMLPDRQDIIESKIDAPRESVLTVNVLRSGGFTLLKTDENGNRVTGSVFQLSGNDVERTLDVSDGQLVVTELTAGTYTLVETRAPDGYRLDPTPRTITITAGQNPEGNVVTVTNEEKKGGVRVVKKNAEGGTVQGAEFELSRQADFVEIVARGTTDEHGVVEFSDISLVSTDRFFVRETSVPYPYELYTGVREIHLNDGEVTDIIFSNERRPWQLIIEKKDEDHLAIAGAVFELSRSEEFNETIQLVTDAEGRASIGGNEPKDEGIWYIRESSVPEPFLLDDTVHTLDVRFGETARLELFNKKVTGRIELTKKDEETKEVLSGATYQIEHESGSRFEASTDTEGRIVINGLPLGRYEISEISSPEGYVLDDETYRVDVAYVDDKTETSVVTTERTNRKIYGRILVVKSEWQSGTPIEGAVFAVFDQHGEKVAELITDQEGRAESPDLPYGQYKVKEVSTPEHFYFDPFETDAVIEEDGERIEIDVANERIELRLRVNKTCAESGTPLPGAVFELFTEDGVKVRLHRDELDPYRLVTDQFGQASAELMLGIGDYILVEVTPPHGYATAEPLIFSVDRETKHIVLDSGSRLLDKQIFDGPTRIEIVKTDENDEPLPGALLRVSDEDNRIVAMFYSDTMPFPLRRLTVGKTYRIEELAAPEGYALAEHLDFEVADTTASQQIRMRNEPTLLEFDKRDQATNEPLADMTFHVMKDGKPLRFERKENGVYRRSPSGNPDIVTDKVGKALVEALPVGEFEIVEVAAPGYLLAPNVRDVRLDARHNKDNPLVVSWFNDALDVHVQKLDQTTKRALKGAHFSLEDEDGKTLLLKAEEGVFKVAADGQPSVEVDEEGRFTLRGLLPGSYFLTEVKAPDGYLPADPIFFTLTDKEREQRIISIDNRPMRFPVTGETDTWTLVGALCLLNGAGLFSIKRLIGGKGQRKRR